MEAGCNSDISFRGVTYHIQTEDWGFDNPYIVSRVFQQGAVIKTFKIHYSQAVQTVQPMSREKWVEHIQVALRRQHDQVMELVRKGQFL